jgi:glycosyltransferase involved in cell wall biosynthesis
VPRLEGHVWLAGERSDIPDAMAAMNVFVMPSLSEGISNTLLEAMASGLPVIATNVGGNPELVADGHNGLLVPAADPAALSAAMMALFRTPGRVRPWGGGARAVLQEFSLDAMVGSYLSLYQALLPESAGASLAAVQSGKALP